MVQDDDPELLEALRVSQAEADSAAELAAAIAASSSGSTSSSSSAPHDPFEGWTRHQLTLLRSFSTLLLEESTLDKDWISDQSLALQFITKEVVEWIDWTAEDARWEKEQEELKQRAEEERLQAEEEKKAAEEAAASGKTPASDAKKKKKPAEPEVPRVPSDVALQLKDAMGPKFVTFVLEGCLIHPDPVTHYNMARFSSLPARRIGFALIEIMVRNNPRNLRVVLEWVAKYKDSAKSLIKDGSSNDEEWNIDSSELTRSETGYVGLKNQAATCYQNSLFQQLFMTENFRKEIMLMRDYDQQEAEPVAEATENDDNSDSKSDTDDLTLLQRIQSIFYYLQHSARKFYDPLDIFVRSFCAIDGKPFNPREQQDVLEFCNLLFERLETNLEKAICSSPNASDDDSTSLSSLAPSSSDNSNNLIRKYFRGYCQNELVCSEYSEENPSHKRVIGKESFYVLSLDINACKTLNECLDKFVQGDMLDGGYMCESCKTKKPTKKRLIIQHWPKIVIFHLKRFDFDFQILKVKKLNDEISFPLEIDLEPYTEDGMKRKDRQEREEAAAKTAAENAPPAEAVPAAAEAHIVSDLEVNEFTPCAKCVRQSTKLCEQCNTTYCSIHEAEVHAALSSAAAANSAAAPAAGDASATSSSSSAAKNDFAKHYRLVGVLVHAGHAEGGHYYDYIRSRNDLDVWHEFNDTSISSFDPRHLASEAFGGLEDAQPAASGDEYNHKGKKKKNKNNDEWQTGKVEKSRNAYMLFYEYIDPEDEKRKQEEQHRAAVAAEEAAVAASLQTLSLNSSSSAAASSPTKLEPSSASMAAEPLPPFLQSLQKRINHENQIQLQREIFLENTYLDAMFKIARANIDWLPTRKERTKLVKPNEAESESKSDSSSTSSISPPTTSSTFSGSRYLDDIDAELDKNDLSVMFIQQFTYFVFDTLARVKENHRFDQWCVVLQHAYNNHVGCCQWLLEYFVLNPRELTVYLLECPSSSLRKSICNLLEVVVKKLIPFELDEEFVDSYHIALPPLKEVKKRADAQASLAAALAGDLSPAANVAAASSSSSSSASSSATSSAVPQSSSSASFLSSALAQGAAVEAQLAPEGLFKPTAKSTVAVSAKVGVLEGIGKGTEKQLNGVGIKTLQNLVEINASQRDAIDKAPTGGMSQAQLQGFVDKAQKAIDFILELSGVNETIEEEKARAAERAAAKRSAAGASSTFKGPKLLPAFFRTCLQTLENIVTSLGVNQHTCPELCTLLINLASCNPEVLKQLLSLGAVNTCIDIVTSPITTVEKAREERKNRAAADISQPEIEDTEEAMAAAIAAAEAAEQAERERKEQRKQRKKERQQKKAAGAAASEDNKEEEEEEKKESEKETDGDPENSTSSKSEKGDDDDDDDSDDYTDLEDLSYVEMVDLILTLVKPCTTRPNRPGESIKLLPNTILSEGEFERLQSKDFLTRLVLQISPTKPDPPSALVQHFVWENNDYTDRLIEAIMDSVDKRDFYDFYAGLKILQFVLLHVHDSLHVYRVELSMPRLIALASENQIYYKATELTIKCFLHLVHHIPACAAWTKTHQDEVKWMDTWLGKNKQMPKLSKDGSAPEGVCLFTVKHGKNEGVNAKWEKQWYDQIEEYHVGVCAIDNLTDYQKIFRKVMLAVKIKK